MDFSKRDQKSLPQPASLLPVFDFSKGGVKPPLSFKGHPKVFPPLAPPGETVRRNELSRWEGAFVVFQWPHMCCFE